MGVRVRRRGRAGAGADDADEDRAEGARSLNAGPLGAAFWRMWSAASISSTGDGLVLVAFPLLAVSLTTDPLLIASVAIAGRLPAFLLALPAGALADRMDRRRLAVLVSVARALALGIFAVAAGTGSDSLPLIYATIFVLGAGEVTFDAATQASLPRLVGHRALPRANGYLLTAEVSGEGFVGPAVGGFALSAGRFIPFAGDAVSFLVSAVLVRTSLPRSELRAQPPPLWAEVGVGLRWFLRQPVLRLLALVIASLAFGQAMVMAELVLFGTRNLHLTHTAYGVFLAVTASGNIFGGLVTGRAHARWGTSTCLIAAAVVSGAAFLGLALSDSVVTAAACLFTEALVVPTGNSVVVSMRQRMTPDHLLGRVGAAFRMVMFGLYPLGALAGGILAQQLGVKTAFAVAGLLQLAVIAGAGPAVVRRVGAAARQLDQEPATASP
jgi:MFS family permease